MDIFLNTRHGFGLGDYLCMLSTWLDVNEQANIYCDNREHHYDRLKELQNLFCIPENKLKIFYREAHSGDFSGGWHTKIFSNYYHPDYVNIKGTKVSTNVPAEKKRYIGLAMYNGLDIYLDNNYNLIRGHEKNEGNHGNRVPEVRWRSIDFYTKIFEICRKFGYDIVTLDQPFDLEFKVGTMVEQCAAVICYEGGIAHLAHMLNIPCIILDFRQPCIDSTYGSFQVEFMHQSNTMYLMREDEELLSMSKKGFANLLDHLNSRYGSNNRLVDGSCRFQPSKGANSKIDFFSNKDGKHLFKSLNGPQISVSAKEFIERFYKNKFPYLDQ